MAPAEPDTPASGSARAEIVRMFSVSCGELFLCKREPVSCVSAAFVSLGLQFEA